MERRCPFIFLTIFLSVTCITMIFLGIIFWPPSTLIRRVPEIDFRNVNNLDFCSHAGLSWESSYPCYVFILYGRNTKECQYSFEESPNRIVLSFRERYGNITIKWISDHWNMKIGCDGDFKIVTDSCNFKCFS